MPGGMPYHLEKGVTLRLIELALNKTRSRKVEALKALREAATTGRPDWVKTLLPALQDDDPGFHLRHTDGGKVRSHILEDWFGKKEGPGPDGTTTWHDTGTLPGCTGHWIAYRGDVEKIVRNALIWALEQALGIEHGGTIPTEASEHRDIELFWKCLCPWFEAWLIRRPVGPITVVFLTPSHVGSDVAEKPLAVAEHALTVDATSPLAHAVPSSEPDYEVLDRPPNPAGPTVPVAAHLRDYATWIVTHSDHVSRGSEPLVLNTAMTADFAQWGIPKLNVYRGTGEVVTVSPSLTAGGVRHDGAVPDSHLSSDVIP